MYRCIQPVQLIIQGLFTKKIIEIETFGGVKNIKISCKKTLLYSLYLLLHLLPNNQNYYITDFHE